MTIALDILGTMTRLGGLVGAGFVVTATIRSFKKEN